MRVGLIIYGSLKTVTGGYIYDDKLVDYLQSRGVTIKVFSQPQKKFWGSVQNNFSKIMLEDIIAFSPDILLQDEMNFASLFLLNKKLREIASFPIISIVHLLQSCTRNFFLTGKITQTIEYNYLKSVNGFIFNSLSTKKSVINMIGDVNCSLIAFPGKDRLKFDNKLNISSKHYNKKLMIIFIGNLTYNKGLHILLHALSEINTNLWRLSIIGGLDFDTKYTKQILNMIDFLKLNNNVKIVGPLNLEKLKKQLLAHHVLVVPSYYESFGIVYAEAMGAGLAVIASKRGGAQEIVADSINGFLVAPGNIEMVRDSIYKLIHNRELLIKMCFAAFSAYKRMPSWDDSMAKVYHFLTRLVD